MPAYKYFTKDGKTKWYANFYYEDWLGKRQHKCKRGFSTKKEAVEWERDFLAQGAKDPDILFSALIKNYIQDCSSRLKLTTLENKQYLIDMKLLPFFKDMKIGDITPIVIHRWQDAMINYRDEKGNPYSQTYLKTINNQMSAIMNYAVKYYKLRSNPCLAAGAIGKSSADEMNIWTREQFDYFLTFEKKSAYRMAFSLMFYGGLRSADDDDKIRLNQRKPSKYKGLRRFGPEKNLQRINKFMKERPIFYKNLIQMKENIRFYLRCFYCITKVMILQFNSENRTELARNG